MSYHSRVDGGFVIEPPLNSHEIRQFPVLEVRGKPQPEIYLGITEEVRELPEGDLHVKVADELNPVQPDSDWSRGSTPQQIQTVVDAYPEHEFIGYMEFLGEDGALWRLYINQKRKVIEVKPKITWSSPNG